VFVISFLARPKNSELLWDIKVNPHEWVIKPGREIDPKQKIPPKFNLGGI
jgi:hypothetical protein